MSEQLDLLRCHYNFIRTHMTLKFGTMYKTLAMQAGLTDRPLTFRQIFMAEVAGMYFAIIVVVQPKWLLRRAA